MRLILQPRDQLEALGALVNRQLHILIVQPPCPVMVVLHHARYGNRQPQLRKDLQRDIHLPSASIHHDDVRKLREAPLGSLKPLFVQLAHLPEPVREPPGEHLLHRGIVIGSRHGLDLELPVGVPKGLALVKYHHRSHRFESVGVGNIVGLHPGDAFDPQQRRDLLHRPDRASLFPLDPLLILFERHLGIVLGHLHQPVVVAPARCQKVDPTSPPLREPFLVHFPGLHLHREIDLPRHQRRFGIVLLQKSRHDLRRQILEADIHEEMLPADHPTPTYEEDLHQRVLSLLGKSHDILVSVVRIGDLLTIHAHTHRLDQIPVAGRLLKFHIGRRGLHLLLQLRHHLLVVPIQEGECPVDLLAVLLLGDGALAHAPALLHMEIEAGPLLPKILREPAIACPQRKKLLHQVNGLMFGAGIGEGTEILSAILFHPSGKEHPRISLSHRHFDIGIGLVVPEHGIVLRVVLLDQIVLQYQRLELGITDNEFEAGDPLHHLLLLDPLIV